MAQEARELDLCGVCGEYVNQKLYWTSPTPGSFDWILCNGCHKDFASSTSLDIERLAAALRNKCECGTCKSEQIQAAGERALVAPSA